MRKIILVLLLLPVLLTAQTYSPLMPGDFPDAIVSTPDLYDLQSVLAYNSDADVFLEFGLQSLTVQEITWDQAKLKVEVYQLRSPESAFGAYSLSVVNCLQRDSSGSYDCNNRYQYQAAYGNLYFSISSESGSDAARSHYLPVAKSIMQRNPQQILVLPDPFNNPRMKQWRKNLVYIQGPVGLQNSLYPWQDIFLSVRFGMFAIYQPGEKNGIYLARIVFENPGDQLRFLTLAGLIQDGVAIPNTGTNDGIYRAYNQIDSQSIYFLQSQEPWPIEAVTDPRN
jgi:hypothetical protein